MTTGTLDQQIFFQHPTQTNDRGQMIETWQPADGDSPQIMAWADVMTQRGSEAFESARVNARVTIRVKIRYRDDIRTEWRFRWNDQIYYITLVDQAERRKGWTWLMAEIRGAA